MKKLSFVACALSALTLASCGGSSSSEDAKEKALDSVKVFAVDVATKVSKNQKDSVEMVYADAAKADSLVLNIVSDSVKVTEIDSVTFSADLGDGKTIGIKKDALGKLAVTESKGLFAYPEKDLDFAKKTGMWADSLTDAQFAERLATMNEFRNYLIGIFKAPKPLVLKRIGSFETNDVSYFGWTTIIKYKVTNTSNKPVSGRDYNVVARCEDIRTSSSWNETKKGKDLAPGGSATFDFEAGYSLGIDGFRIVYTNANTNKAQQFEENFVPKGNEYEQFLKTKKK